MYFIWEMVQETETRTKMPVFKKQRIEEGKSLRLWVRAGAWAH